MYKYALILGCILLAGCGISTPFDWMKSSNGDAKATQQVTTTEDQDINVYISNNPWFAMPDVQELMQDGTIKKCTGDSCPLGTLQDKQLPITINPDNTPQVIEITNPDGKKLKYTIPAKAYYIIQIQKKTNSTTLTEFVNELKKSYQEYGKILIYCGVGIIFLFGLIGYFSKSLPLAFLGLVLGGGCAGIAYYPIVGVVIMGIALLMMVCFAIYEIRNKAVANTDNKQLQAKITKLEKENRVLWGTVTPEEAKTIQLQLKGE